MAAKRRHRKEKGGRFRARIAIPAALRPCFGGKTELIEPLGGDRREADRKHAAAVARLQARIEQARRTLQPRPAQPTPAAPAMSMTRADYERAIWGHYTGVMQRDEERRASMPAMEQMTAEYERLMKRIDAGEIDGGRDPIGMTNAYSVYEMMVEARDHDHQLRARRLTVLRNALGHGDTRPVERIVEQVIAENGLAVERGSRDWQALVEGIARAEIAALQQTLERDEGN